MTHPRAFAVVTALATVVGCNPKPNEEEPASDDRASRVVQASAATTGALGVTAWKSAIGKRLYVTGYDATGQVRAEIAQWDTRGPAGLEGGVGLNLGRGAVYYRYAGAEGADVRVLQDDFAGDPAAANALRLAVSDFQTSSGASFEVRALRRSSLGPSNVPGGLTRGTGDLVDKSCGEDNLVTTGGKSCDELIDGEVQARLYRQQCTEYICFDLESGEAITRATDFSQEERVAMNCETVLKTIPPGCFNRAQGWERIVDDYGCARCRDPEEAAAVRDADEGYTIIGSFP